MYEKFYQLSERPFSITPNPRYVFLSAHHQDALAHLLYGIGQGGSGGFVQLTGEVGTGKTTLCRLMLEEVPEKTQVALILNPMLGPVELLEAICRELEIEVPESVGSNLLRLQNALTQYLLACHARGEHVVLIIDEAQNLSEEALEQVRMLTNLETATDKLLQIILIGQPELRTLLKRPSLRQLAQRITARYHLEALDRDETHAYVKHRLTVAGAPRCPFSDKALDTLFEETSGVPRLLNIVADRALLAGFTLDQSVIDETLVRSAAREVRGENKGSDPSPLRATLAMGGIIVLLIFGFALAWMISEYELRPGIGGLANWEEGLLQGPRNDGWQEGAGLWSALTTDSVRAACTGEPIVVDGVACLALRGSWSYLSRVGLPALLRLHGTQQQHALVTMVDRSEVVIRYQGQTYRVPRNRLERYWRGEFFLIWPDDGELWSVSDVADEIRIAKRLASRVENNPWTGDSTERFGADFEQWIMVFQQEMGLVSDGVIGPATRLFLGVPQTELQDRALMPLTVEPRTE